MRPDSTEIILRMAAAGDDEIGLSPDRFLPHAVSNGQLLEFRFGTW
jgi:hypothetical protein